MHSQEEWERLWGAQEQVAASPTKAVLALDDDRLREIRTWLATVQAMNHSVAKSTLSTAPRNWSDQCEVLLAAYDAQAAALAAAEVERDALRKLVQAGQEYFDLRKCQGPSPFAAAAPVAESQPTPWCARCQATEAQVKAPGYRCQMCEDEFGENVQP